MALTCLNRDNFTKSGINWIFFFFCYLHIEEENIHFIKQFVKVEIFLLDEFLMHTRQGMFGFVVLV